MSYSYGQELWLQLCNIATITTTFPKNHLYFAKLSENVLLTHRQLQILTKACGYFFFYRFAKIL